MIKMDAETQVLDKENAMSLKPKPLRLRKRAARPQLAPLQQQPQAEPFLSRKSPKQPRNPFRRSLVAKRKLEDAEDEDSLMWRHSHRPLDSPTTPETKRSLPSPVLPSMLDECALSAFSETVLETKEKPPAPSPTPLLPVDWSLKTKVRFTSSSPFPSRGSFKTFEEVNGTIGFVRCLHPQDTDKVSGLHSSLGAKFFQQSLVWTHPALPWLPLFPRTHSTRSGPPALSPSAQEILHSKWCDSLRSLYQLVRLYQCPFFYVCGGRFTALFRCAGAASSPALHALLAPTTRGLRNALREEGISFTMPLCNEPDSPPCDTPDDEDDNDNNEEEGENLAEDDASWLESLGLSQDAFPSLHRKKRRGDLSHRVDHRPSSLVCVEDSETQALVNFLLNSEFCSDKIGPLTGIPPTLLAPTAFLGGTLTPLQMRVGKVKQGNVELDSVELSGPLLPSALHSLCSLLSSSQGSFSATLTPLPTTEAFAQVQLHSPLVPCIFAENNLADCGLPPPFVTQMCRPPGPLLRTLHCTEQGLYTPNHNTPPQRENH